MANYMKPTEATYKLGLDIGSTTVKAAVMAQDEQLVFSCYKRHYADLYGTLEIILQDIAQALGEYPVSVVITGSGGLTISEVFNVPFVQEVIAASRAVRRYFPDISAVIELGGEDAKLTFFENGIDQRMNGICAGGTGAFIDQMSLLLKTDPAGLDKLAENYEVIYPIAARCGVFAKTDIQALLNEGARQEDIAASVFQAVVNQTISGLSCGRKIKGKVALLGGPLYFLPQLRRRFQETLSIGIEDFVLPENAQVFVAIGAALAAQTLIAEIPATLGSLTEKIASCKLTKHCASERYRPLFTDKEEYIEFLKRHSENKLHKKDIASFRGNCFLGLDIGSTTCKAAVIDSEANLLFSYYAGNEGSPLKSAVLLLQSVYSSLPIEARIAHAAVTGYGENLIKSAFSCDIGEVETIAHYTAAEFLLPGVETILDIGGQDMKYLKVKAGVIESVILNEACSSGCGSFIQTFANALGQSVQDFSQAGIYAGAPVDLGSRCTVFMNSKVKQVQKDGVPTGDISAGLSYSVVRNALYKVIKLKDAAQLGSKIVVQGGTFRNDAVLRCFELLTGREVVRPDMPELMGAFGAALLAKRAWREGVESTLISPQALLRFSFNAGIARCGKCANQCLLTINSFNNGKKLVTGHRCERGDENNNREEMPNIYDYKYQKLFSYKPLEADKAPRGSIGIPRVLNMYENYPFWFTFFTELGFRVVLSPPSSRKLYELGMDTISSDTACYPAKLANGHVVALIRQGLKHIFYPCLPKEKDEYPDAENHFNCPIVACYPEVIQANIDQLRDEGVSFHHPFLPYHHKKRLIQRLYDEFKEFAISYNEISRAVTAAWGEDLKFKADIRQKGEEVLRYLRESGRKGIVLSGRPYHLDPEVHHGVPSIITALGLAVLTEDSISHLGKVDRPLRVLDQWMYHTRLYESADFVAQEAQLELVQLNSFGCGPDSVAAEQAHEILDKHNKLYTMIKIDEVNNLGAVRIRLRSLKAAVLARTQSKALLQSPINKKAVHPKIRHHEYTIIGPQMAPIHFELLKEAIRSEGYHFDVLETADQDDIEEGLKYVNNDSCYPAIIIVGQILRALKSGNYDLSKTAVLLSQTNGPCRASNYVALLDAALEENGLQSIPIISLSLGQNKRSDHLKITYSLMHKAIKAMIYGDVLMKLLYQVRPYEINPGATDTLYTGWIQHLKSSIKKENRRGFRENLVKIVKDFDQIEKSKEEKIKVGLVGEILVKYHPTANNNLAAYLEKQGAVLVVPGLTEFFLYCALGREYEYQFLAGRSKDRFVGHLFIKLVEGYRNDMRHALSQTKSFKAPATIYELADKVKSMLSLCNRSGEGWLLTSEMVDLIENDVTNILCMQPFACLPNHISGRGMIKTLKEKYPQTHFVAIDYDPGASNVNQLNRIKLMLESNRA